MIKISCGFPTAWFTIISMWNLIFNHLFMKSEFSRRLSEQRLAHIFPFNYILNTNTCQNMLMSWMYTSIGITSNIGDVFAVRPNSRIRSLVGSWICTVKSFDAKTKYLVLLSFQLVSPIMLARDIKNKTF